MYSNPGLRFWNQVLGMKAAVAALALACQLLLIGSTEEANAFTGNFNATTAGAPISSAALNSAGSEHHQYAIELNDIAYQLILEGSYREAEGRLRQALLFEPEYICAHNNLGYVLSRTGRAKEALPHLQYAYTRAQNQPAIMQTLAATYQIYGDFKSAVDLYELYLHRFPTAPDAASISALVKHLKRESALFIAQNKPESKVPVPGEANLPAVKNFNWSSRQIKVYAQSGKGMHGFRPGFDRILQDSFATWTKTGVVSFVFVDSPAKADIECVWTDDASKLSSAGEGGETLISKHGERTTHAKILLLTNRDGSAKLSDRDVRILCLHEIGHALGMMKHSANPGDVMFCTLASADNPSPQDFQALKNLYR